MTNCLEGIFAFLKIPFIPKGKRVVSEGKIYICIYIHTRARTQTHTKTNIFFFPLNKMQVLQISFSFVGTRGWVLFWPRWLWERGVLVLLQQELREGCPFTTRPCTHQLLLQISSCSLQGMLISSRQGREKPQGWIKDEARRASGTSAPSRDRLALE